MYCQAGAFSEKSKKNCLSICYTGYICKGGDFLNFRYFDATGNQLTAEQLKSMRIATPAMEHILATVKERIEKNWKSAEALEACTNKRYN